MLFNILCIEMSEIENEHDLTKESFLSPNAILLYTFTMSHSLCAP